MIVLDTSIWIEFFRGNQSYSPIVKDLLEKRSILAVECIFGELLQGALSRREQTVIESYWKNLPKSSSEEVFIEAGKYSSDNRLHIKGVGLIDCVIVISCRKYKAQLWSLDKKLNSLLRKEELFVP